MTEQQRYEVVRQTPGFELRRYPAHSVAEVEVDGSFEAAGNQAFRPLVGYIRGRNEASQSLGMTAPVIQRRADERADDVDADELDGVAWADVETVTAERHQGDSSCPS